MSGSTSFSVAVHPFRSPTRYSCAYESGPPSSRNAILFIGGLGDGPHTVPYVRAIAKFLESTPELSYSVFEIRMTSSFTGFGTSSLSKDVADISALVAYLRSIGKEKVVLFGHSTGCQDCVAYADYDSHSRSPVDGYILQGPVSDREGIATLNPPIDGEALQESLDVAASMIASGRGGDCLPKAKVLGVYDSPISAYRFNSLVSKGGDDDFFSTDLDEARLSSVWGRFQNPILVLHSAEDEYVPSHVDKEALIKTWKGYSAHIDPLSGLIPGGSHSVKDPTAQQWLAKRVAEFLTKLGS